MAKLVMVQGVGQGPQQFMLQGQEVVIGRQPDVDLRLDAREVSRRHARIVIDGMTHNLEDLGSANGTYLNGTRLSGQMELHEQDQIRIGPYLMRFETSPASEGELIIRASVTANTSNLDIFRQDAERKLQAVLDIAHQLTRSLDLEEVLPKLLDRILHLFTQADRALILLLEGDQPVVRAVRSRNQLRADGPVYSRSVVKRVLEEGIGIVAEDALGDQRFNVIQTINRLGVRSFICVPLKAPSDGRPLGTLQLDRFGFGSPFTEEDLHMLTAVSLQVAVVLENASMHADLVERARMKRDLALAREIQEGFLPQEGPVLADGRVDWFARVYPAQEVSGDFFDYVVLDDQRIAFTVADVSGKGIPAAVFMTGVRALWRHVASSSPSPARVLQTLNDALAADNPTMMFVTMLFGIYDATTGELTLANGGHPQALIRRANGRVDLAPHAPGRLLGFAPGKLPIEDKAAQLEPGDTLLLYTDGVTEALGPDREMFGMERLCNTLASLPANQPLDAWGDRIKKAVDVYTDGAGSHDDVTLLLLQRPTT